MKQFGLVVFCLGLIAIVAAFSMDTSVPSGGLGRVHNLGLMQDKQNLLIISALLTLVGSVMIVVGSVVKPFPQKNTVGQKIALGFSWVVVALASGWLIYSFVPQRQHETSLASVFQATDITGAAFARDFRLTDHNGQVRTLADFKGKAVAVFFGYIHCPDVCPTTLSDFALALKQLGPQAERVQVIFVTVDPQRDTPELLKQFVPAFNPGFLGMFTDAETLKALAKEYKVVYQKTSVKGVDDYLIDHSAGTYVYDPQGHLRLLMPYGSSPEAIAQDLKTLLAPS